LEGGAAVGLMRVVMLGCGGSGGVPLPDGSPGGYWGAADPGNPKNCRRRSSVLVEEGTRRLLIDCTPDLREQLITAGPGRLDAVLFTHAHADHTHGLDDLRALSYRQGKPVPAYMDEATRATLTLRFDYAFRSSHKQDRLYPALMDDRLIEAGVPFEAAGFQVLAFVQDHGNVHSLGFRIGGFAYSTDLVGLDETAMAALQGLDLWIVDCLRHEPHPTHTHFASTLRWIEQLKPKRAVLTHMNQSVDYAKLAADCPPGVEPGYDGLAVEL
jgi:phosphoribosyl 1,2-cyclic phosphate phosphodiesterase